MNKMILLTLPQLAEATGISYPTLFRWVKSGKIPYIRSGNRYRVNLARFEEYLQTADERNSDAV